MFPRAAERMLCRFALIVAVFIAMRSPLPAAPPDYFLRSWQVEQGLPQNKVTAVVQTGDGYLWVGTYCGLARFDGIRFTVFDDSNTPELRSSRITSLFEAGDGTLWIGTESGSVSSYKDGHFSVFPLHAQWNGGKIYAITADAAGDVWLLNEAGELARVRDNAVLSPPSGTVTNIVSLARASDGTVWVGRAGAVSVLKDGAITHGPFTNEYVQGFCAARDGGFWAACSSHLRKWKDGDWVADFGPMPWGWGLVMNLLETSSGALVAGTSDAGLWLVVPGETNAPPGQFDRNDGLPSDWVISLCEDREKNLWAGTGGGLALIRRNNLENVSPPDHWKNRPVLSVLPTSDGALWVGTEGAGLYRLQDGVWTNFDASRGIRNPYVWSLAESAGRLWVGTWGGGLFTQKDGAFDFAPGLENFLSPMPAMLVAADGLWIGTTAGARRYQNGQLERFDQIDGEPFGDVRAMARDKAGVLWFGTAGNGLVRREKGHFQRFKKSNGLSSDFVECLHFANDGTLWIGTFGGGLNRLKGGKFSVISREQGLPNGVIGHIESDG
ncbi:MAG TPA: two-component regulator propeller domain-containing protein, partial [Verrucomicrobiae bacterium]